MADAINGARGMIEGTVWSHAHSSQQLLEGLGMAVLALAEQQQVANRIALAEYELHALGRITIHEGFGVLANPTTPVGDYTLQPDIIEALA